MKDTNEEVINDEKPYQKSSGAAWLILSLVILTLDWLSKTKAVTALKNKQGIKINDYFNLQYAENKGAAFSFLSDQGGWQIYFLLSVAFIVSLVLTINLVIKKEIKDPKTLQLAYACIIGGSLGNGLDRLINGYVIDFLQVHWKENYFPIFNIADIFISIGGFFLVITILKEER